MAGANEQTIAGKVVCEYLDDNPDLPNLTLAKLIYSREGDLYKSIEHVRGMIRYYRHQKGASGRKGILSDKYKCERAEKANALGIGNPYSLPEADDEDWEVFDVPTGSSRVLLLSDIHIPHHTVEALTIAIDHGVQENANAVYLNGDILDMYQLSRYVKDPRKRKFSEELEMCRQFLGVLQKTFDCPIYFKLGNHEQRYEDFLKLKAKELLDVNSFRLQELLQFGRYGVTLIESRQMAKIGKLPVLHGHEFGRSVFSPVNPARGYFNRAKKSMIAGHNHQTSSHSEKNLDGEGTTVWSTGCLCSLRPEYMPFNKWNHGAAFIKVNQDRTYRVHNFKIENGNIY